MRLLPPVLLLAIVASSAAADGRHTTVRVTLRARPGEKQAAVATVPARTDVKVVEERGRWIRVKVKVGGKTRTGWLTRTTLDEPSAQAPPEQPGPPPSAAWDDAAATATATAPVPPAAGTAASAPRPVGVAPAITPSPAAVDVRADLGLGYRSLDMHFTSDGSGGLANYLISADATVAELAASATARPWARRLVLAVDGRARATYSSPGLEYTGPSLPSGDIPFTLFEVDAGVRAGVQRRGLGVALHGGVHYGAFLAEDVANAGRLPRERLRGLTAGVRGEVAPVRSPVHVELAFDLLVAGDRRQTPGLEDGPTSDAGALWAGAAIRYHLARRWSAFGALSYTRATTSWAGASVRQPGVMSASRVDQSEIVQLGLGAEL